MSATFGKLMLCIYNHPLYSVEESICLTALSNCQHRQVSCLLDSGLSNSPPPRVYILVYSPCSQYEGKTKRKKEGILYIPFHFLISTLWRLCGVQSEKYELYPKKQALGESSK
jgi:hypothetical protein